MLDLPTRIFLASARRPLHDGQGFVLPLPAGEVVPASELLNYAAALIVAPPWTGKTFVSEQLHRALAGRPDLFRARLGFETLGRSAALKPSWWDDWSRGDGHACWIVDAVDEDERSGDRRIDEVLGLLEELPEAARNRLHALFFCRESEVPPAFLRRAEALYGVWSPANPNGLRRLRLAGLDRESARAFVGAEAFDRVGRILAANDLGELAALPVVLEHLKGRPAEEPLDRTEIWTGVLKDLLRDRPGRTRPPFTRVEVEDRLEVVQWLATVLTFSGQRELRVDAAGPGPDLETLIPSEIPGREFRILREAARDALHTPVFEPAGEGYRFAQDHVREWFAALTLRSLPLGRVRPLLTTEDGEPNPAHAGLLDLLGRVASDPELRAWIETARGGPVAPGAWTLREAVRALDRLQELSRSSPWGLALWQEDRLARLAAPGLGAEIARRLEGPLSTPEQELLLDLARAVGAGEAVAPALRILRESVQEPDRALRVRAMAADLLARLGEAGQIAALEPWVRSRKGETGAGALPILALSFYRHGIWDFETAAGFALSRSSPGGDWLQSVLSEELTLDRARSLLAGASKASRSPLVRRAVELLLDQEEPAESDWNLLLPPSLAESGSPDLLGVFARHPEARRKLFLSGLERDPERRLEGSWRWRSVLRPEDAAWLLEVVRGRNGEPGWLWETLYHLAHGQGVSRRLRLRVRAEMEAGLLAQLDQEREEWRREERRRSRPQLAPEVSGSAEEPPADGRWLDQTRAQEGAEGVLAEAGTPRPASPGAIPVEKVVRFLQDARFRLLRTADDLQAVVLEELRAISRDAKEHLAMLYRPLEDGKRRRLPEEALQAYLYCRLGDRLSRGILEPHPVITLNREPLAARNMRNDIKVEALSLDNRLLTLIVEVKWSDNREMATSLVEQLGRRYLKESGLTHGIYLVGWCGSAGAGPEDWQTRLEDQARRFQREEPGLKISPVLLDLGWEIGT